MQQCKRARFWMHARLKQKKRPGSNGIQTTNIYEPAHNAAAPKVAPGFLIRVRPFISLPHRLHTARVRTRPSRLVVADELRNPALVVRKRGATHEQTIIAAGSAMAGRGYFHHRAFDAALGGIHRAAAHIRHRMPRRHPHCAALAA